MRTFVSIGSGCGCCAIKPTAANISAAKSDNTFFIIFILVVDYFV